VAKPREARKSAKTPAKSEMRMTPSQKIKHKMITQEIALGNIEAGEPITAENLDAEWDALEETDTFHDCMNEFRCGEVETGLPCEWSRHYESKSVAAKMFDGSWVGWTYWYGGGKHGEPGAIDWMSDAYDLDCVEEEKLVTVRTFAKRGPK
jgi:hypothetical protein